MSGEERPVEEGEGYKLTGAAVAGFIVTMVLIAAAYIAGYQNGKGAVETTVVAPPPASGPAESGDQGSSGDAAGAAQEEAPADDSGGAMADAGAQVFADNCAACHGADGSGGGGGPALAGASLSLDAVRDQVENGGGGMPPFGDQLDSEQIDAVSSFVVNELAQSGDVGQQKRGSGGGQDGGGGQGG